MEATLATEAMTAGVSHMSGYACASIRTEPYHWNEMKQPYNMSQQLQAVV